MNERKFKEFVEVYNKEDGCGIAIKTENNETIKKLKTINYTFIKYMDMQSFNVEEDGVIKVEKFHYINFEKMPIKILNSIVDEINAKVQENNDRVDEILNFIINLFNSHKFRTSLENELVGDIGELIFMIKSKEIGISMDKYYHQDNQSLYDFYIKDFAIEVKTTSKLSNKIILTKRQIDETNNKEIVVVNFQKVENKLTIIDLFNHLNSVNPDIIEKRDEYIKWLNGDNISKKLINTYTVDLQSAECFFLDQNLLPKINVIHNGGLKEIKCEIDISTSDKNNLYKLKKIVNN